MNSKTFKEMIKKHQVKRTFAYTGGQHTGDPESITIWYVDTTDNTKVYSHMQEIIDGHLLKNIAEQDEVAYKRAWLWYKEQTAMNRAGEQDTIADINIYYGMSRGEFETPMEHRKYYKLKAEILRFMLKDKRFS